MSDDQPPSLEGESEEYKRLYEQMVLEEMQNMEQYFKQQAQLDSPGYRRAEDDKLYRTEENDTRMYGPPPASIPIVDQSHIEANQRARRDFDEYANTLESTRRSSHAAPVSNPTENWKLETHSPPRHYVSKQTNVQYNDDSTIVSATDSLGMKNSEAMGRAKQNEYARLLAQDSADRNGEKSNLFSPTRLLNRSPKGNEKEFFRTEGSLQP